MPESKFTNDGELKAKEDRLTSVVGQMIEIKEKAEADDRGFTTEEQTQFSNLEVEATELKNEIDQLEAAFKADASIDTLRKFMSRGRKSQPTQTDSGNKKRVPPFGSWEEGGLGSLARSVYNFAVSGDIDPRMQQGHNIGVPSEGGVLVDSDYITELDSKMYDESALLSRVRILPISSSSNMIKLRMLRESSRVDGSRRGGVRAYWEGEGTSATASQEAFETLELVLRKLTAFTYVTEEMMEDVAAIQSELETGYSEEMSFTLEDSIINGDGVAKPLGIMNSAALVTVAVESGQTSADPLLVENIVKMWARLHPRSQRNAIWLVDPTLLPHLFTLGITYGTGGQAIYLPGNGNIAEAPFGTLMGRPVLTTEYTQTANTTGDILLIDPTEYRLARKGGVRNQSSVHFSFNTGETAFRFVTRANGAPRWSTALTPKNSGDTLSPFVALATRS